MIDKLSHTKGDSLGGLPLVDVQVLMVVGVDESRGRHSE